MVTVEYKTHFAVVSVINMLTNDLSTSLKYCSYENMNSYQ